MTERKVHSPANCSVNLTPDPSPTPYVLNAAAADAAARGEAKSYVKVGFTTYCASVVSDWTHAMDAVWGFMLATVSMLPVKDTLELMRGGTRGLYNPLAYQTDVIESSGYGGFIVECRKSVIAERKLDESTLKDRLDPTGVKFYECCLATASVEEQTVIDLHHAELALALQMRAVVRRSQAYDLEQQLKRVREEYTDKQMREYDAFIAQLDEQASSNSTGLLCTRDRYGNIRSTEYLDNPDIKALAELLSQVKGQPASDVSFWTYDNSAGSLIRMRNATPIYKPRGEMLVDLSNDLQRLQNEINALEKPNAADSPHKTELQRLYVQQARFLEMKALVHEQTAYRSPHRRPVLPKPGTSRFAKRQECDATEARILKLFAYYNTQNTDKNAAVGHVLDTIGMRLVKRTAIFFGTGEFPTSETEIMQGIADVWNKWKDEFNELQKEAKSDVPVDIVRAFFANTERFYEWVVTLTTALPKYEKPHAPMLIKVRDKARSYRHLPPAEAAKLPVFIKCDRTSEECVRDQLYVFAFMSRYLVRRYRLIHDWLFGGLFDPPQHAVPGEVVTMHASRLLACCGTPTDVALWMSGKMDAELKSNSGSNSMHEEKWHVWDSKHYDFPSSAARIAYEERTRLFVKDLTFCNKKIRRNFEMLTGFSQQFLLLHPGHPSPMNMQLKCFDLHCRSHLTLALQSHWRAEAKKVVAQLIPKDIEQAGREIEQLKEAWDALPLTVRCMLPQRMMDLTTNLTACPWRRTAKSRGHRAYAYFVRAHLYLQSPATALALAVRKSAAYERLLLETSSPCAFARAREREMRKKGSVQLTDAMQSDFLFAMGAEMALIDQERRALLTMRMGLHAKALTDLVASDKWKSPSWSDGTNWSTQVVVCILDGFAFPILDEWESEHVPDNMRQGLEKVCLEICGKNRDMATIARKYREHVSQLGYPMNLDPFSIDYSLMDAQLQVLMYQQQMGIGKKGTDDWKMPEGAGENGLKSLNSRLRMCLDLYRELPKFGGRSMVTSSNKAPPRLDIAKSVYRQLVLRVNFGLSV